MPMLVDFPVAVGNIIKIDTLQQGEAVCLTRFELITRVMPSQRHFDRRDNFRLPLTDRRKPNNFPFWSSRIIETTELGRINFGIPILCKPVVHRHPGYYVGMVADIMPSTSPTELRKIITLSELPSIFQRFPSLQ